MMLIHRLFFKISLFTLCMLCSGLSYSHEGRPVYIELIAMPEQNYLLEWKVPPVLTAGDEPSISLLSSGCERLQGYRQSGLLGKKTYHCSGGDLDNDSTALKRDLVIKIDYPEANPALSSLLVFKALDGDSRQIFSAPDKTHILIPKTRNFFEVAKQYLLGGIQHILKGYDHLLFILCLLALARTRKRLLLTISGFTLAHSITLLMASLGYMSVNILLVEALIALSIAVLAAEVIKGIRFNRKYSVAWQYPVLAASTLGLLHGFGFASVLTELGLPNKLKLSALLFFNIGIEVGQILFVCVVLLLLSFVLKTVDSTGQKALEQKMIIASMFVIGVSGAYWAIERLVFVF